jgi:hypothetical protein
MTAATPNVLVAALSAMETFLAKDSDVIFLTLEVNPAGAKPADVNFGMIFADQDDNGKNVLSAPVGWDQLNLADPLIPSVNTLHRALADAVATPKGQAAIQDYLATRTVPALSISDVRRDLAALVTDEDAASRPSRPRPGR